MTGCSIALAGSVAQNSRYGGHVWVFLQYLLGFRRLGYDVLLIDRLEPEMCEADRSPASSSELRRLRAILEHFGLSDAYVVLDGDGQSLAGVSRDEVLRRTERCAFLLDVMGFLDDPEIAAAASRRVFFDIDPGFPQMWRELGLADVMTGHHLFVTLGENIGTRGCEIPSCGVDWIRTRPPVVLEHWPPQPTAQAPSFASIGAWRGPFAPVEYEGRRYGLRVHEFRAFAQLPTLTGARFRAALDIDPCEVSDLELLDEGGWERLNPAPRTGDPLSYRDFIADAGAELGIAKEMYVRSRSGWFSDRSACFLASGRPVLAQDTALPQEYLSGEGLLLFSDLEEAVRGASELLRDYPSHACAARALAERLFDSDRVLGALAEELRE